MALLKGHVQCDRENLRKEVERGSKGPIYQLLTA